MAKIDVSKIEGYESMSTEDKLKALEGFEYDDNANRIKELENAKTKANGEAADWKRKYNEKLTEDERKKAEETEQLQTMKAELEELRKSKTVSEYKAKYIAQGYSEVLAESTAKALAENDTVTVFANQNTFLKEYEEKIKSELLKGTPSPQGGTGDSGTDYAKKIEEAQKGGDMAAVAYYTRLQAQAAASNKQ